MVDVINNIRIFEDSLAFVLLTIIIVYLGIVAWKLRKTPTFYQPMSFIIGLIPLYLWKSLGALRRMFVDKVTSPELYNTMHDIGEAFESLSGLVLALAVVFIFYKLKKE